MGGQYAGMGGQHDPEWGVSIVRNLQYILPFILISWKPSKCSWPVKPLSNNGDAGVLV